MVIDLCYRLRLADDLFCRAAENFVAAATLEEWQSRSEVIENLREYARSLQIINADFCRIIEGKQALFPAELPDWIFELPDGESKVQNYLEHLHNIAKALKMTADRELLHMESDQ